MLTDDRIFFPQSAPGLNPARLALTTAPAVEVWSSADEAVQLALKLDPAGADNVYVDMVLTAARTYFERITGLALITQTWTAAFDRLPACGREITLPRAPLQSIDDFQVLDESGAPVAFADFTPGEIGVASSFARLWLDADAAWPTVGSFPGAVQIEFTVGFGDASTDVPQDIRSAVLFLAAHWYENRLPVNVGNIVNELPFHLSSLVEMHRVAFIA